MTTLTMTKTAQRRLEAALDDVVSLVGAGAAPNDAILKIARAQGLAVGHIDLLARAYNTGWTRHQQIDGADPHEKAADFPLADPDQIRETLYPSTVKSAAARDAEQGVSPEYSAPPRWYQNAQRAHWMTKAAEIDWALPGGKPAPLPSDPALALKRAYAECERADQALAEARLVAHQERERLLDTLKKLADYFRTPGMLSLGDVAANVETLHGDAGASVLRYIAAMRPELTKTAAHRPRHSVREHAVPYGLVKAAIDHGRHVRIFDAGVESLAREIQLTKAALLAPFRPAFVANPATALGRFEASQAEKAAEGAVDNLLRFGTATNLISATANRVRGNHEEAQRRALDQIASPDHERQLRDIQVQAMLQDFMAHDPVIKGHDPLEVTRQFNRLSQFAPRVSSQPLLMESLLRKALTGPMDTFEHAETGKVEKGLHETQPHYVAKPEHKPKYQGNETVTHTARPGLQGMVFGPQVERERTETATTPGGTITHIHKPATPPKAPAGGTP